ncbi:MAG: hypothetical protein ACRDU5_05735, partial [Mycobacterium sp.]
MDPTIHAALPLKALRASHSGSTHNFHRPTQQKETTWRPAVHIETASVSGRPDCVLIDNLARLHWYALDPRERGHDRTCRSVRAVGNST